MSFYKIKTYGKMGENCKSKTYKDVTPPNETVFDSLKLLLIEATRRERDEDTLVRLATCDSVGTEVETYPFIRINKGAKKVRLLEAIT